MEPNAYHNRIVTYYKETENAYKDSWDLNNSLAIHYGYWDEEVQSFPQSLLRMNEVMMDAAAVTAADRVLDAGCGVGGSTLFLAEVCGCRATGITLSQRQVELARSNALAKQAGSQVDFQVMDYCHTRYADESFDVVWGCESICYAESKAQFISEAYRILKPGGRLVVADGFVTRFSNNEHPVIRNWLDGWQVNYLETPGRFSEFMKTSGFVDIHYRDISKYTYRSSRRLNKFYYLANLYLAWKTLTFSNKASEMQKKNIAACKSQYRGIKRGLWEYGLITGKKPSN